MWATCKSLLRIFMACNFFWLEFLNTSEIAAVLKPLVVRCVGHSLCYFNLCISFFLLELQCIIEGACRQCWRVVGDLYVCRCKAYLWHLLACLKDCRYEQRRETLINQLVAAHVVVSLMLLVWLQNLNVNSTLNIVKGCWSVGGASWIFSTREGLLLCRNGRVKELCLKWSHQ